MGPSETATAARITATPAPGTARDQLRRIRVLADLADEQLDWLVEHGQFQDLAPGEISTVEGSPADRMIMVVEGEIHARREKGPADGQLRIIRAGDVSGMLPFSRLVHFPLTARAAAPTRLVLVQAALFPEMLRKIPELEARLVGVLADRVRESTQIDEQREKLMALGKLSAGLAHELNNPAAALQRAADELRRRLQALRQLAVRLIECGLTPEAMAAACELRRAAVERPVSELDPVAAGEREGDLGDWLGSHAVSEPWVAAATLASAGIEIADLDRLAAAMSAESLPCVLNWLEGGLAADSLLSEMAEATRRISKLVGSVKSYSHMDSGEGLIEVDLRQEIDSTLTMLTHKVRAKGVELERNFDPALPPIPAYGGELNQVWTNLLDNALDAVPPGGHIAIRTARENDMALIEIRDDGPGIPPDLQSRIWEPFFTTKPVGQGTGLGLEIALRIVCRRHGGSLQLASTPGDTRFTVRLPLKQVEIVPEALPEADTEGAGGAGS
jgi:signal transduction histidine kinase